MVDGGGGGGGIHALVNFSCISDYIHTCTVNIQLSHGTLRLSHSPKPPRTSVASHYLSVVCLQRHHIPLGVVFCLVLTDFIPPPPPPPPIEQESYLKRYFFQSEINSFTLPTKHRFEYSPVSTSLSESPVRSMRMGVSDYPC